jgi:hypothetical protein
MSEQRNPTIPTIYSVAARDHAPWGTKKSPVVARILIPAKNRRDLFRVPPLSAIAPSNGANIATIRLAVETETPSQKVLSVGWLPSLQKSLKKIGKKPAMTVVAKAEFAQSYITQPNTAFRSLFPPDELCMEKCSVENVCAYRYGNFW